jgi:radical SAM superfamily enzyme YgiQ (UPF0313 family)
MRRPRTDRPTSAAAGTAREAGTALQAEWLRPGAVVLLSCYELGHQPLGLAAPLGMLRERGFAPDAVDLALDRLDPGRLSGARFVGISVPMHTAMRLGIGIARRVRELRPTAHICFYGLYASLNAELVLEDIADSVVGGEYLQPLVALLVELASGRVTPVPGVRTRDRVSAVSLDRPGRAVPSRGGLPPLERYARLEHGERTALAGYVETTHGCLHLCRHCPIPPVYGGRFVAVPREDVLADIRALADSGATHITFGDPDFLNGPGHTMRIVREMHAAMPELTFDATTKVEHILRHRHLLSELRELGCVFLVSAVESLSDRVLGHLRKGHTAADVHEALDLVRIAGITLRPSLVAFTPWTTLEDYLKLLDFAESAELGGALEPVQLAIRLLIPPGSSLLEQVQGESWLGPLAGEQLSFQWTHLDPRMDRLYEGVLRVVEAAAREAADPRLVLHSVRALACSAAGLPHPAPGEPHLGRDRPPRLTEEWFC